MGCGRRTRQQWVRLADAGPGGMISSDPVPDSGRGFLPGESLQGQRFLAALMAILVLEAGAPEGVAHSAPLRRSDR